MKLHPYTVHAIWLREHPNHSIIDGSNEYWYCPNTNKYYWRNHNAKKRNGIYEARGLQGYWEGYLRLIDMGETGNE